MEREPYEEGDARQVVELMGLSAAALRAVGVLSGTEPGPARWLRAAPTLLVVVVFAATSAAGLCRERVDDLEEMSEGIFICTTVIVSTARMLYFLAYRMRLQRLASLLLEARRCFPVQGAALRSRYQRHAANVCIGFQATAVLPVSLWVLDPLLTAAVTSQNTNNASADAAAEASRLPLSLWLPVDGRQSPSYEAVYAFEGFLVVFTAQVLLFLDMLFIVLIIHITAELNVLNDSVAAIREAVAGGGETGNGTDASGKLDNTYGSVSRSDSDMYGQLVEAIRHHQTVMRYVQELEDFMSQPLYILLFTNMMNMCLHMFTFVVLLQKDIERSSMVKMMLTFPAYLYQTGTYCIFGQTIIDQSERLLWSAGSCGWPEAAPGFRSALLVLMAQASRPLCVRVGKLVTLSRNTFLQLLKDTYTMFNMLYTLQGNK